MTIDHDNYSERGQSLTEIIISLGLIGLFITAAVGAMAVALRNSVDVKTMQAATYLIQDYSDKARAIAESDWHKIYDLGKGSVNSYMVVASGTQLLVLAGEESMLENNVINGLVGQWKFDEAAGAVAYDFSGNGNQGILTNGPIRTASSSCKVGSCLSFDGVGNYVDAGAQSLGGNITIVAWIYPRDISANWAGIVNKNNVAQQRVFRFGQYSTNGYLRFGVYLNGQNETALDTDSAVLANNNWYYIAATYDGNFQKIYVNGSLIKTSPDRNMVLPAGTSAYWIGKSTAPAYFNGLIDDVRIYNRALSASEIQGLYQARVFTRKFYVENVKRDSCGVGNITPNPTTACRMETGSGYVADDPSTQKTTAAVNWEVGRLISQTQYLSRYRNKIFDQTDWSGGSGQEGPITDLNNKFTISTGLSATTTAGSILIQGF